MQKVNNYARFCGKYDICTWEKLSACWRLINAMNIWGVGGCANFQNLEALEKNDMPFDKYFLTTLINLELSQIASTFIDRIDKSHFGRIQLLLEKMIETFEAVQREVALLSAKEARGARDAQAS